MKKRAHGSVDTLKADMACNVVPPPSGFRSGEGKIGHLIEANPDN